MEFQAYDIALVPVVVFLTAFAGRLGWPKKLLPVISLVLSIVAGLMYLSPTDPKLGLLLGLGLCMTSVGAYSSAKNMFEHFAAE